MRVEHAVSRREFLAITATAIAAGLLKPSSLAYGEGENDTVNLGRIQFDYSFEWDKDDVMVPPGTRDEYVSLHNMEMGELVRLEPFDEDRPVRSESIYPCCKLVSGNGCSWDGLLDDKLGLDMRALKLFEVGHPIYAYVESRDVMNFDYLWPIKQQLVTLTLDVFVSLCD